MIVATWNVNSVLARLPVVLRWLEAARPDVLCLQEVKCTAERFPGILRAQRAECSDVPGPLGAI